MQKKIKNNKNINWLWFPIVCFAFVFMFGFCLIKPVKAYSFESPNFSQYGSSGLDITFDLSATNGFTYVYSPNKNMPIEYEDVDFSDYQARYTHVISSDALSSVYLNGAWDIASLNFGESTRYHYYESFAFRDDYLYFDGFSLYVNNFENVSKLGVNSPKIMLQKPGGSYVQFVNYYCEFYFYYILNDVNHSNTLEYEWGTINLSFANNPSNEIDLFNIYSMIKEDFGDNDYYIQDIAIYPTYSNLSSESPFFVMDYFITYKHFEDYNSSHLVGDLLTPSNNSFYEWVTRFISNLPVDVDFSDWLVNSVGAFMNAELFPGFAIGGIFAVMVAFPLVIWFLKLVLGG